MPEITKYWNDTAWNRDHESLKVGVVSNHYLGGDVVTIDCSTTDMGGETWTTKLRFPREEFKEFLAMCMLRVLTTGGDDDDQTQSGPAAESSPQTTKLVCGWCKGSGKDYSEWPGRWVHCGSCGGNGASKQ